MKKLSLFVALTAIILMSWPDRIAAAGGIYASGGGTKQTGQTFTITVAASGADFDSLQGTISVNGPVDIVSFVGNGATWLPGKAPGNGTQFVGICNPTSSLAVATIKLKATSVGSGSVSVGDVKLARNGVITGTGAGGADFIIERAPDLPDAITVSSSTHPDQNTAYEAMTVALNWERTKGVTGFSYVYDQSPTTVPPTKANISDTSITLNNMAIGIYYFHIRAQNADGWGPTTHYKITIKEPDAKVDETLAKPTVTSIEKSSSFTNDIENGTVTGLIIRGKTTPGYTANLTFAPVPTIPEGKTLSALANASGVFEYTVDYPIKAGSYLLSIQGQKDKTLTPVSETIKFEVSQVKGGSVHIITNSDKLPPKIEVPPAKKWYEKITRSEQIGLGIFLLLLLASNFTTLEIMRFRRKKSS